MKKKRLLLVVCCSVLYAIYLISSNRKLDKNVLFEKRPQVDTKELGYGKNFSSVRTLVMFIGYPRSGSTLFGSLMDAHPNMVIGNECNLLTIPFDKYERVNLFEMLWDSSVKDSISGRRAAEKKTFFDYNVPGLWQGSSNGTILVIGDKKASSTTSLIINQPSKLEALMGIVRIPVKFIHVIRNPFDNMATIILREIGLRKHLENVSSTKISTTNIIEGVQLYFKLVTKNLEIRKKFPGQYLDVYYPDLRANPTKVLKTMCRFLQVPCDSEYLNKCARIVLNNSTLTRQYIPWSDEVIERILNVTKDINFLKRFSFKN